MTVFRAGSATDVGRVRSNNQDSHLVREGELFAVADGMGGHQGGEVASATALDILGQAYDEANTPTLVRAVRSANQAVFDKASGDPDLKGMGTTLTAPGRRRDAGRASGWPSSTWATPASTCCATAAIEQLTEDHSLVAGLVREGRITAEEAESHPQRNILTRALGIDEAVAVDSWEVEPVVGDRFLICSDGLFNEVDQNQMAATLRRLDDPVDAARELVRLANEGGGRDNITAVVVDVVSTDDDAAPAARPAIRRPSRPSTPPRSPTARRRRDPATSPAVARAPRRRATATTTSRKARRLTWRVVVFVLAAPAAGRSWSSAPSAGTPARPTSSPSTTSRSSIFRGRPGGFLWFDPTVEERTGITPDDVPDGRAARARGRRRPGHARRRRALRRQPRGPDRPATTDHHDDDHDHRRPRRPPTGRPAAGTPGTAGRSRTGTTDPWPHPGAGPSSA